MKQRAKIEAIFSVIYLVSVALIGGILMVSASESSERALVSLMAWVLIAGDTFHLVPRIAQTIKKTDDHNAHWAGRGKQLASITMTIFYVFLWHVGIQLFSITDTIIWTAIIYILAGVRMFLTLLPQNDWLSKVPPVRWAIIRNIPFVLLGIMVAVLFFINKDLIEAIRWVWLWIVLSFAFYIPVVLGVNKHPWMGVFMLPKSVAYVGLLVTFLFVG